MPMQRFGQFEIDLDAGALHRRGEPIHLPPQAFKVLALLVRQGGGIVTRAEIREQLWGTGTHVEFDQGLNFCIRQVREALGDHADSPQYIETLPRRGYRLLTPVASSAVEAPAKLTRLIVLPFRVLRRGPGHGLPRLQPSGRDHGSLSGLESLIVRSSLVASRFAGAPVDEKAIGAQADVDVIVTGTLMRAGKDIRVSAQLTDVSTGTLLWSKTEQAPVGDCFQLQDDLTRHIVASLELPLSAGDKRRLTSDVPSSTQAYDYFLRGNQLSVDAKQWTVARDLYEQCVAEDPRYAPAWARLGRMYHVMAKFLETGTNEGLGLAESAFKQALALNADQLDGAQAVCAARGRPGTRARRDGASARARAHRRRRSDGGTGEGLPVLRIARRIARGPCAWTPARCEAQDERGAHVVHAGRLRPHDQQFRWPNSRTLARCRWRSWGAATKRCRCCASSRRRRRRGSAISLSRRARCSRATARKASPR